MAYRQQKKLSNERESDLREKRELVDKYLKIIMYVPPYVQEYKQNYE